MFYANSLICISFFFVYDWFMNSFYTWISSFFIRDIWFTLAKYFWSIFSGMTHNPICVWWESKTLISRLGWVLNSAPHTVSISMLLSAKYTYNVSCRGLVVNDLETYHTHMSCELYHNYIDPKIFYIMGISRIGP